MERRGSGYLWSQTDAELMEALETMPLPEGVLVDLSVFGNSTPEGISDTVTVLRIALKRNKIVSLNFLNVEASESYIGGLIRAMWETLTREELRRVEAWGLSEEEAALFDLGMRLVMKSQEQAGALPVAA